MRKIHYYIATSLDGFIANSDGGHKGFLMQGEHATDFLSDLSNYDTVLMGAKTYESGYAYGLKPGQVAYPGMRNIVFSSSLQFSELDDGIELIHSEAIGFTRDLKSTEGKPIYLSGGAQLAGSLFREGLIDEVKIKVNPILLGDGIPLTVGLKDHIALVLKSQKVYLNGVTVNSFQVQSAKG